MMQNIAGSLSIEDPTQMKSCLKRFAGNRSSKRSSDPKVFNGTCDMKRRKRVKFVERDAVPAVSCQPDVSSVSTDRNNASGCDDPKTSEYRSFKKLLEEAGRSSHSHRLVRQTDRLSIGHTRDLRNEHICSNEATESVLPVEKVTPINQESSLLPARALNDKEPEYKNDGGTFYEKRQNLIKFAASCLSLEVNELLLKGSDLIPVFLRRLGINRKADNCDKLQKMNIENANVKSHWLACPNMHKYLEQPCETPRRRHMPTVIRDIAESNFPQGWWSKADELYLPVEHVDVQFFPVWDMSKLELPKRPTHLNFLLDSPYLPAKDKSNLDFNPSEEVAISRCRQPMLGRRISVSSWVNHELSPFWDLFKEQPVHSHGNFHFLELDLLHSPNKAKGFSRHHSNLPLLGWNDEISDEEELSVASESAEVEGLYQLPLTLYHCPRPYGPIGGSAINESCTQSNVFHSFGDVRILKDMICHPNLDCDLLPSGTEFAAGLAWDDLPSDCSIDNFLSCNTPHQLSCISSDVFQ